ncbi:MAG: hypothetical protein U0835_03650 [Isosphaeraceae bacterium]
MTETPAAVPNPEATTTEAPARGFWRKRATDRPRWVRFEQAVYGSFAFRDDGYTVLAQSPRCRPEWVAGFRTACQKIGERPTGVAEFPGLFALPLEGGVWAVVGMSPQGLDDRGRPGALAFHGLFLSRRDYRKTGCDPFRIAAVLRSDWDATTETLPSGLLRLDSSDPSTEPSPDDPRAARIAAALARGRRVAFEAPGPAEDLARQVWRALPERTRRKTSVATWAFGNANRFGLVALPRLAGVTLDASYADPAAFSAEGASCPDDGPTSWLDQAAGRLPRLPVEPQTLALVSGAVLLAGAAVAFALRGPDDDPPSPSSPPTVETPADAAPRPVASARVERPKRVATAPGLPDPADYPSAAEDDDPAERRRVAEVLEDLADRCGLPRPAGSDAKADPLPLMEQLATRLRYRGPWLAEADRANLAEAEPPRARALAIAWHDAVRRFAPDRPLPDDFRSGSLRWQLAVLFWSFHLEPPADRVGEGPRRTVSELAQAFAGSLAREVAVGPDPLTERYGALAGYAAFLARLPRR